jgi:GNAT superfamily N-acetyltransferase
MQLRDLGGPGIAGWRQPLIELYAQVYAEPPWLETPQEAATFADRLAEQAQRPGFRCAIAHEDERLLGACYGYSAGAGPLSDTPFYRALASGVDQEVVREYLVGEVCEVAELMVASIARRRGLGRALINRLLRDQRRAWLCTHPTGSGLAFYRTNGWTVRGQFTAPSGMPLLVCT